MVFRSTYDLHFKIIEQLGVRFANYFHPAILDAVAKHHSEKARTCMTRHLEDFIEMIRVNQCQTTINYTERTGGMKAQ